MKGKTMLWIVGGVVVVGVVGLVAWGSVVSNSVEQAKYDVTASAGNIQIRDYAPHIVAEVEVLGEREASINQGFRLIADYIFGNNTASAKVAMTAPVIQQPNEKVAMTAPVIQQGSGNEWKVQFVMPSRYNMNTLPKPNNDAVKLHEISDTRFAVIRFSDVADTESLKRQTDKLNEFIVAKKLVAISQPSFAFFNPPWTLPFLRRNEVMIQIAN
jgi:hypothetical protein